MPKLFDMKLRAMRRDRAARIGPERFLFDRVFTDCLERIGLADRRFEHGLLIGCPDPEWRDRLRPIVGELDIRDPGALFAAACGGVTLTEDTWEAPPQLYDLVLTVGTLDTVNELPLALRLLRHSLQAGGLCIGALAGGDTLPQLRAAMRAAEALAGVAAPRVHPRVEAAALSPLLDQAGFLDPVVDIERVPVSYPSLDRLVADLRAMGATNILTTRGPPLTRPQVEAARRAFANSGEAGRVIETFEIVHFAAWTGPEG